MLALILALKSPELDVLAVTLTHGNTTLQNVKRNAVTLMDVMAAQHHQDEEAGVETRKHSPVLAVGTLTETVIDMTPVLTFEHARSQHAIRQRSSVCY